MSTSATVTLPVYHAVSTGQRPPQTGKFVSAVVVAGSMQAPGLRGLVSPAVSVPGATNALGSVPVLSKPESCLPQAPEAEV